METINLILNILLVLFHASVIIYAGFNYTAFQAPPQETEKAKATITQSGLSLFIGMCLMIGIKSYSQTLETTVFYIFLGSYLLFSLLSFYFFPLKERNKLNFIKIISIGLEWLIIVRFIQLVFFQ